MKKRKFHLVVFWVINFVLLLAANLVFPNNFVLGTYRYSVLGAAAISALVWAIILVVSKYILKIIKLNLENEIAKTVVYFLISFVALWLIARFAPYTGFGVTSFVWLLGLAVVAEFFYLAKHWLMHKLHLKRK